MKCTEGGEKGAQSGLAMYLWFLGDITYVRSHFVPIEDESSSLIKNLNSQGNYKVSPQPQFHGAKWQSFLLIPWIGCKSTARMSFYTPG